MGLDYLYVDQGNDIGSLISAFQKVKDIDHPVVVHINTLKGKGYRPAEEHKEPWHYCAPFDIATGEPKHKSDDGEDYGTLTADYLLAKMKEDRRVVGITAGTPTIMGFTEDRRLAAGRQFVDVGIAEEHAVALASGIAKAGGKPVFGVCSSFIQRLTTNFARPLHQQQPGHATRLLGLALGHERRHAPLFLRHPTHQPHPQHGLSRPDLQGRILRHVGMEPAARQPPRSHPRAGTRADACDREIATDYSELNRYEMVRREQKLALLALGSFFPLGESVAHILKEKAGIEATLSTRVISPERTTPY